VRALRAGAIAFAIAKERITREKHASGFYKEVIDYCLGAEGITLDDVDLIVRNCYILPVAEIEERLVYQDRPGFLPGYERARPPNIHCICRTRTRWCRYRTIWRTPTARSRHRRSMAGR
jgi:Carbamoyltransferase N-terminus